MRLHTAVLILLTLLVSASIVHAELDTLWDHSYGDGEDQYVNACVADASGNVVITGAFYGSINITTPLTSLGRRDAILAKFAPNGTPLWSSRIGFQSVDTGLDVTTDVVGAAVVVGIAGPHPNQRSAFIARYTPAGAQQWIKYFASSPDSNASAQAVGVDVSKHILVAGQFDGSINFGGATLVAQAQGDIFLAEFDALGTHVWSKSFTNGGNFDEVGGLGVDPSGQPVIFGAFQGSVNFGGATLNSVTNYDLFLAKFNENGTHQWSKRFGTTAYHYANALAVGANGRIAITGESWGNIDFGGGNLVAPGGPDGFVAVLTPAGGHVWSKMFGAGDQEYGTGVAFAPNLDVLLTAWGYGTDPFTFGGDPMAGQPSWGDFYVARFFGANGDHRWSYRFYGVGGSTYGYVGATGGDVFLAGAMGGDTDLGITPLVNQGGDDIFVVRYSDYLTGASPTLARASLLQNTPNPFNPQTSIGYTLTSPAHAVIEIFDASGAVVSRLDEGQKPAGTYSTAWNGRDASGRVVASGVYFYRLAGMPDVEAKKMVLLK